MLASPVPVDILVRQESLASRVAQVSLERKGTKANGDLKALDCQDQRDPEELQVMYSE